MMPNTSRTKQIVFPMDQLPVLPPQFLKNTHIQIPILNRKQRSTPGTIDVFTEGRHIINMNSQYYPGRFNDAYENDTEVMRKKYFHQCLLKIAKLPDLQSIAFPYLIGCGLGGGNWDHYEQMLNNFAKYVFDKQKTKTFIVRLDQ